MEEMVLEKQGIGERMLRELIGNPKFKTSLRMLLNEIDPAAAAGLVRAVVQEDVETFMGTASALPSLVNYLVQVLHEAAVQFSIFPTPILIAFFMQIVEGIDFKAMEETVTKFKVILEDLQPVIDGLKEASAGVLSQIAAE